MKTKLIGLILTAAWLIGHGEPSRAADTKPGAINVMEMRAVPDGHYLVNLELEGKEVWLNLKVKDQQAECVKSSDQMLKGLQGRFRQLGIGTFLLQLQNESYRASQVWIFRKDGSAAIRESPDRGEMQKAIPVDSDTIVPPKGRN